MLLRLLLGRQLFPGLGALLSLIEVPRNSGLKFGPQYIAARAELDAVRGICQRAVHHSAGVPLDVGSPQCRVPQIVAASLPTPSEAFFSSPHRGHLRRGSCL